MATWGGNPNDAAILDLNTRMASVTTAAGVMLVDQRANLLLWEEANNAPAPGDSGGKFCFDDPGVHPGHPGELLMGTWAIAVLREEDAFPDAGVTVVFPGNSITLAQWYAVPGGFLDQLYIEIGPMAASTTWGTASASWGVACRTRPVKAIAQGVGGANIADLNVATMVAPYAPALVVPEYGINDAFEGTTGPDFEASYEDKVDEMQALTPEPAILCLNILCRGEQWVA